MVETSILFQVALVGIELVRANKERNNWYLDNVLRASIIQLLDCMFFTASCLIRMECSTELEDRSIFPNIDSIFLSTIPATGRAPSKVRRAHDGVLCGSTRS
jgi:hypothetical protein